MLRGISIKKMSTMSNPEKPSLFMKILAYGLIIPVGFLISLLIPIVAEIILRLGAAFLMDVNKDSKRADEDKRPD
jgi:hypothetical protein